MYHQSSPSLWVQSFWHPIKVRCCRNSLELLDSEKEAEIFHFTHADQGLEFSDHEQQGLTSVSDWGEVAERREGKGSE